MVIKGTKRYMNSHLNLRSKITTDKVHSSVAILTYIEGVTDRIRKVLRKHKVRYVLKSLSKISNHLPFANDRLNPLVFTVFPTYVVQCI